MSSPRSRTKPSQKTFCIKAEGRSMLPLLYTGDIVEYKKTSLSKVRINDIVLTYKDGIFMTHRVTYKTRNYIITRGDNNRGADGRAHPNHILGKVTRFKRNGVWHTIEEQYIAQSLYYLKEVKKISKKLQIRNIPHVFVKGVVTSLKHHGQLPQRIYADCDLLIHREDFQKVRLIFEQENYTFVQNQQSVAIQSKDSTPKFEGDFYKKVGTTPIYFDVHLEPVFLMTKLNGMGFLYKDSTRKKLGSHFINNRDWIMFGKDDRYPVCSVTDQILYLALHFFHHNNTDITRLYFLHELIRKNGRRVQWNEFIQTTKRFSLSAYVYPALVLLKRYFKTTIPQEVLRQLALHGYKKKVVSIAMRHSDIFSEDARLRAGIMRFILIFVLSPEPMWKKALLFVHPDTILSTLWVLMLKISRTFTSSKKRELGSV